MLIKTERPLDATDNPTMTAAKRLGRFMAGVDMDRLRDRKRRETLTIPGLDLGALSRQWGPQTAGMPRIHQGTFRVPLGITPSAYHQLRNEAAAKFLKAMNSGGFELKPWPGRNTPISVYPGIYPAIDLLTGTALLGEREFIIEAYFSYRHSKRITLELPSEVVRPLVVNA